MRRYLLAGLGPLLLATLIALGCVKPARPAHTSIEAPLEILRNQPDDRATVDGCRTGPAGGRRGTFFLAAKDLIGKKDLAYFQTLIADEKPVIRVLGAYCIIRTQKSPEQYLAALQTDTAHVLFNSYGCMVYDEEVQYVVNVLLDNPDELDCDTR